MPSATPKRCRQVNCGNSTTNKHGYCDTHKHYESNWRKFQDKKKQKGKRVYQTSQWKRTAKHVKELADNLCLNHLLGNPSIAVVGTIAEHIIPVAKGGSESLENLSCFCAECANHKTGWEQTKSKEEILKRYGHTTVAKYKGRGVKIV